MPWGDAILKSGASIFFVRGLTTNTDIRLNIWSRLNNPHAFICMWSILKSSFSCLNVLCKLHSETTVFICKHIAPGLGSEPGGLVVETYLQSHQKWRDQSDRRADRCLLCKWPTGFDPWYPAWFPQVQSNSWVQSQDVTPKQTEPHEVDVGGSSANASANSFSHYPEPNSS